MLTLAQNRPGHSASRSRCAGPPRPSRRIRSAGVPHRAAAAGYPSLAGRIPGLGSVGHGLVFEGPGRIAGHGEPAPLLLAGLRVIGRHIAAHAVFGAAVAARMLCTSTCAVTARICSGGPSYRTRRASWVTGCGRATLAPLLRPSARYCKLITPISAARFAGFTGSVHRAIETAPKQTGRVGVA